MQLAKSAIQYFEGFLLKRRKTINILKVSYKQKKTIIVKARSGLITTPPRP